MRHTVRYFRNTQSRKRSNIANGVGNYINEIWGINRHLILRLPIYQNKTMPYYLGIPLVISR